ncbi:DUF1102 domain-containing protein [Geoglobus acetivorans]|uniref:DUF1102 domain-containing protein n=1 Tax=Geoglobus acetivorans TaxID=565033 RepID=A0A0A7GEP2_GEOAI|nr:hypothetical protein GACE_1513 [Geoglobus acetivorans]
MNKIIYLVMFSIAIALVSGLSADFRMYHAERNFTIAIVTDDQELIDLTPNQPYAFIDSDNGELIVRFDAENENYPGYGKGVSPDSRYVFDDVFCVSNDLWEENMTIGMDIDLSSELQGIVKIYSDKSDEGNTDPANATSNLHVVIENGDKACIGFVIDTTGIKTGDYTGEMTMHAYPYQE